MGERKNDCFENGYDLQYNTTDIHIKSSV